ncbi:type II toxin-antitoxin system MqsA family antitoxin [Agrobacterium sp. rho-13.3]|uniref:type II toxin-antitoxin system MqsA family antitoxin n=1 Tax=Agrobacterium sp. rho-13.3 TaxID=3072980 RepID=UPI0039B776A6
MSCQVCGSRNAKPTILDLTYEFEGNTTTIQGVSGDACDDCGEFLISRTDTRRVSDERFRFRNGYLPTD